MNTEKIVGYVTRKTVGAFCALLCIGSLVLGAIVGCKSNTTPAPDPKTVAAETVSTLTLAWNVAAEGCAAVAQAQNSNAELQQCAAAFMPALDLLEDAASMIDTWSDADQANLPCVLADAAAALSHTTTLLTQFSVTVPPELAQGLTLAEAFIPQCNRSDAATADGGALGAAPATPATAAEFERTLKTMRAARADASTGDAK